ncbi:LptF/LptG family permease [Chitinophagales bacterium]|nr:LptF/LptG family permease [Chitinophagales bacterium]
MKLIDRLILTSFVGPFVITLFLGWIVLILQFLWKHIDDLVGKGFELDVLGELLFYSSLTLIPMILPLAILLASIITLGNLAERYELVALKSAGISLMRFMRPLLVFSFFLAGVAFYFSNYILPDANLKYSARMYSVVRQKPALNLKEGQFNNDLVGYSIKIGSKDDDNVTLRDVSIWDHSGVKGYERLLTAEKGIMFSPPDDSILVFKLFDGYRYEEIKENPDKRDHWEHTRMKFKEFELLMDMSIFDTKEANEDMFKSNPRMLNVGQLRAEIDSLDVKKKRIPDRVEQQIRPYFKTIGKDLELNRADDCLLLGFHQENIDTTNLLALLGFPIKERAQLLEKAKNDARNVKSFSTWGAKQQHRKMKKTNLFWMYIFNKFALSFSCIVLFLIGAALGAITQKGGLGMPMVLAIIFFVTYHLLNTVGRKLGEELIIDAFSGSFFSSYFLFPLAIFLMIKASNDSELFKSDFYRSLLGR